MNQQELLGLYDTYFPSAIPKSDEEKWLDLKSIWEEQGSSLPDYVPTLESVEELYNQPNSNQEANLAKRVKENSAGTPYNPEEIDDPNILNKFLSSSVSEFFIENGDPLGLGSSDYYKYTHNNSMAGLWYKKTYGKNEYEYDDAEYDPGVLGHITSFFMGLASPLDISSLAFGGIAGKGGAQIAKGGLLKKWGAETVEELSKKELRNKVGTYNLATGAAETGLNLAAFSGSHAALNSAATQKEETGEIDYYKVLTDGAWGALESGVIGTVTGGIVKGPMQTAYSYNKLSENPGLREGITKALTNPVSPGGVEGVAFTTIPYVLGSAGLPGFHSPGFEDFTWEEYLKGIVINSGIVGSMKAIARFTGDPMKDEIDLIKATYEVVKSKTGKERKAQESIRDILISEDGTIPKELVKEITDLHSRERSFTEEQEYLMPAMKRVQEIAKKPFESWTESDKVYFLKHGVIGDVANARMGMIKDFLKDPEEIFTKYEEMKGVKLSQNDKDVMKARMAGRLNTYENAREMANKSAIGGEMNFERPWTRNDVSIESYLTKDNKEAFIIKSKDTGKDFFEGISFENKAEAERYLKDWFETYEKEYADSWKVQTKENPETMSVDELLNANIRFKGSDETITPKETQTQRLLREFKERKEGKDLVDAVRVDEFGNPIFEQGKVPFFKITKEELLELESVEGPTRVISRAEAEKVLKDIGTDPKNIIFKEESLTSAGQQAQGPLASQLKGLEQQVSKLTEMLTEQQAKADVLTGEAFHAEAVSKVLEFSKLNKTDKLTFDELSKARLTTAEISQLFNKLQNGKYKAKKLFSDLDKENKINLIMLNRYAQSSQGGKNNPNWNSRFLKEFQDRKIKISELDNASIIDDFIYKWGFIQKKMPDGTKKEVPIYEAGSKSDIQRIKNAFMALGGRTTTGEMQASKSMYGDINLADKMHPKLRNLQKEISDMPSGMLPSKKNVREQGVKMAKELDANNPQFGGAYSLVTELVAKYGLRQMEVNAIGKYYHTSQFPLILQDPTTKLWYLNLHGTVGDKSKGFRKMRTQNREVLIEESFALDLRNFLDKNKDISIFEKVTENISKELFKKGFSDNTKKAIHDFRSRNKLEYREGMTDPEYYNLNAVFGHQKGAVEAAYTKLGLADKLRWQQEHLFKNEGFIKSGEYESPNLYQRTATGKAPSVADSEFYNFLQKQISKNKGVKANITSEDLNFAGRYHKGVIDIVRGKANMRTWFHENTHRLEDFIYSVGDKRQIKLWETFRDRFKGDIEKSGYYKKYKNKREAESEWMADNISAWALKQEMPRSLYQRMGNFIKRLWSKTKQALFGKESLNEKDIRRILGEKVWQGFETGKVEWGGMERFQMADVTGLEKNTRKLFKETIAEPGKSPSRLDIKDWKERIAGMAKIENPEAFKFKTATVEELYSFNEALNLFQGERGAISVQKYREMKRKQDINDMRIKADIDDAVQMSLLKALNVEGADIRKATESQLKMYEEIIFDRIKNTPESKRAMYDEQINLDVLNNAGLGKITSKLMATGTLPVFQVIEMLGLKKVSSRLHDHMGMEIRHAGQTLIKFEDIASKLVGKKWEGRVLGVKYKKDGYQDAIWVVDHERFIRRKKENLLTENEKNFAKKAFTKEYLEAETPFKASEIENFTRRTNEGKLVKAYNEARLYIKNEINDVVKMHMNDAEYKQWRKDNNIQWVEDGVFFTRQVSKEFKQHFNLKGREIEKLIEADAKKRVEEQVKLKKGKISDKEMSIIEENARIEAETRFQAGQEFGAVKFNPGSLKKRRHEPLPERIFVPEKNKWIETYERKWESSGKKYFLTMSKLLANMEMFPEYVNIKGTQFPSVKTAIPELQRLGGAQGRKYATFVERNIRRQLGIGEEGSPFNLPASWGEKAASFLAKTQLSAPTSGFKNVLLGQQMNASTYGILGFARGLLGLFNRELKQDVKYSGHTQIGIRNIDRSSKGLGFADLAFKFGLMKPTEDINRYTAVAAGKYHFNRQLDILKAHNPKRKTYKRAEETLRTFYKMSDRQVELLKEYGAEGAYKNNLDPVKRRLVQRELDTAYQKANAMAHINTQGASLQLFMPEFAGMKFIKPLTLYKRMAYAATTNMVRNTKDGLKDIRAGKPSGMVKLAMVGLGPYISGEILMGLYYHLLGEDPPKENSDWWTRYKTTMWKGEFLGVVSDVISPFQDRDGLKSTMTPAIYNYLITQGSNFWNELLGDKKSFDKWLEDFAKGTFSGYNAYLKVLRKRNNPYNRGFMKFNKLWADFEEEMGPDKASGGSQFTSRFSKYYRDLRDSWNIDGPTEEFARLYMSYHAVLTQEYLSDYAKDGTPIYTPKQASKKASDWLENFITKTMNPNPIQMYPGTERATKLKYKDFYNWLHKDKEKGAQYKAELQELVKEFKQRIGQFKIILKKVRKEKGSI